MLFRSEAFATWLHARVRVECGIAQSMSPEDAIGEAHRGIRPAFGYPACPNLADQRQLLKLLGAERIGVALSDEDQLHPEQSTSAIVCHHPQAKYFSV